VSVSVSEISLICQLLAKSKETDTGNPSPPPISYLQIILSKLSLVFDHCRDSNSDGSSFTLSKLDVVLGGGETKRVGSRTKS
ncbi:hypothetical protein GW17_00016387, partial [Ensete ventricosum]